MARLLCSASVCFISYLFLKFCNAQQLNDGFNIYKDIQIGKSNDILKDGDAKEILNKDELVLPSLAAKVNIDDTSKRNSKFRNLMLTREFPGSETFGDFLVDPLYSMILQPESRITTPRFTKNFALQPVDKKSAECGQFCKDDYYHYYKRLPGSVLALHLASSRPNPRADIRQTSGKHSHLQPSSFIATMGKRFLADC